MGRLHILDDAHYMKKSWLDTLNDALYILNGALHIHVLKGWREWKSLQRRLIDWLIDWLDSVLRCIGYISASLYHGGDDGI